MKLNPITPIGETKARGFVDYEDRSKSGLYEWMEPVYPPPCAEAVKLRELRGDVRLTLRKAADRLGLKPSEVSGLEVGRLAPESWDELFGLLLGGVQ